MSNNIKLSRLNIIILYKKQRKIQAKLKKNTEVLLLSKLGNIKKRIKNKKIS